MNMWIIINLSETIFIFSNISTEKTTALFFSFVRPIVFTHSTGGSLNAVSVYLSAEVSPVIFGKKQPFTCIRKPLYALVFTPAV